MANAWYRIGTVSVTNGSAVVIGSGTLFLGNINPGDILLAPDGNDYEIKTVPSDEQLTIARKNGVASYAGTTQAGQPYAIIRTGPNNALLANQLAELASGWLLDRQQYAAWQGGVYNGGVNGDGKYPLTDAEGVTTLVLCPAALMSMASLVGEATNVAEENALFAAGYRFVIRTDLIAGYVPESLPPTGTVSMLVIADIAPTSTIIMVIS